jgi:hypothetical protein
VGVRRSRGRVCPPPADPILPSGGSLPATRHFLSSVQPDSHFLNRIESILISDQVLD